MTYDEQEVFKYLSSASVLSTALELESEIAKVRERIFQDFVENVCTGFEQRLRQQDLTTKWRLKVTSKGFGSRKIEVQAEANVYDFRMEFKSRGYYGWYRTGKVSADAGPVTDREKGLVAKMREGKYTVKEYTKEAGCYLGFFYFDESEGQSMNYQENLAVLAMHEDNADRTHPRAGGIAENLWKSFSDYESDFIG